MLPDAREDPAGDTRDEECADECEHDQTDRDLEQDDRRP